MKTKIAEALKTKYKRFGLSNEAIDRIASAKKETITKEEDIESGIADAATMELIANELQKMRDKEINNKTDLQRSFDDYKAKHPEGQPTPPDPDPDPKPNPDDWKAALAAAVKESLAPLQEEIANLKGQNSTKAALEGARSKFFESDYAKAYPDEANDAWERAVEMNEATGNKMNADQLHEKVTGYFNKAVARKGVDTSKPFKAESPEDEKKGTVDWSKEVERKKAQGLIPDEKK